MNSHFINVLCYSLLTASVCANPLTFSETQEWSEQLFAMTDPRKLYPENANRCSERFPTLRFRSVETGHQPTKTDRLERTVLNQS